MLLDEKLTSLPVGRSAFAFGAKAYHPEGMRGLILPFANFFFTSIQPICRLKMSA
jgi:hypothetical protein